MSDLKHTPEPWDENTHGNFGITHKALPTEDYKRVIACVNHCKGATNKELEQRSHEELFYMLENEARDNGFYEQKIKQLKAERDQLLNALIYLVNCNTVKSMDCDIPDAVDKARAVIDKTKGSAL